ncbi:hypothetical protein ILYODFUR_012099 [Ilyodon furcidens]|uniref:Uncharacterized protein n=1 Tax=Ilyodon furcidens TaxID=33524 RepID=A0ABV0TV14_9TELE
MNTSMNLPQSTGLPRTTGSNSTILPRSTCPDCPPSNKTHQLEEPARTACQYANLSFCGLLTSPSFNKLIKKQQQSSTNLALVEVSGSIQAIQNQLPMG